MSPRTPALDANSQGSPVIVLSGRLLFPTAEVELDALVDGSLKGRSLINTVRDRTEVVVATLVGPVATSPSAQDFFPVCVAAKARVRSGSPATLKVECRARITTILATEPLLRASWERLDDTDASAGGALWTEVRDILNYLQIVHRQIPVAMIRALLKTVEAPASEAVVSWTLDATLCLPHVPLTFEDRASLLSERSLERRIESASRLLRRTFDAMIAAPAAPRRGSSAAAAAPAPVPLPRSATPLAGSSAPPARTPAERPIEALPVPVQLALVRAREQGATAYAGFLRSLPWAWLARTDVDVRAVASRLDRIEGLDTATQAVTEKVASLQQSTFPTPLCVSGPQGVDKAVVGEAIAEGLGRPLVRIRLAGATEADLRGEVHTAGYAVTAGRLARGLVDAGAANPIMILEDVDALADEAACVALLEAFDASRNQTFLDRYVGIGVDLSRVFFILTADDQRRIPARLSTAIETVSLRAYSPTEKRSVLEGRLLPIARRRAGIGEDRFALAPPVLDALLQRSAHEPGVREASAALDKLLRSVSVDLSLGVAAVSVDLSDLERRIGPPSARGASATADSERTTMVSRRAALGGYRLLERVGEGGMAEVFLGERDDRPTRVAVKRMRSEVAGEPGFREMFLDEARLAALLHHPNIIEIIEIGDDRGVPFLVMELCRGVSLHRLHKYLRTLEPELVAVLGTQILEGLHYAHELRDQYGAPLGVVHRDVSPQNIMVDDAGVVRILDFGIARATGRTTRTATGVVKGKVAYMAPEQLDGTEDRRADLFAVGVVLCELLCGERHAQGDDVVIMKQLVRRDFAPPAALAHAPDALRAVVLRALQPEAAHRFDTALEMARALEASLPFDVAEARLRIGELIRTVGEPAATTGSLTAATDPDATVT